MDIVILTPITKEYLAFLPFLEEQKPCTVDGVVYVKGRFTGVEYTYDLAIRQTGSGNSRIALATEKAIQAFQPKLVLLAGIAGGVKDAGIGDLVVATKAYGYESGKESKDGFLSRPEVLPFDEALLNLLRQFALDFPAAGSPAAAGFNREMKVYFGPIASGDKVIASRESPVYRLLKQHYNDTLALEMESIGFASAVQSHRHIRALNIRGISDLLDQKKHADEQGYQERTAERVARFFFAFLKQLDFQILNPLPMDEKKLVRKILELIFPLLRLPAVQNIGNEFAEATDQSILELWQKVRPVFIEEIEGSGEDLEQQEVQQEIKGAIKSSLRKTLRDNSELAEQLAALVQAAEQKQEPSAGNVVSHSTNVIQGSQISVGRDLNMKSGKK